MKTPSNENIPMSECFDNNVESILCTMFMKSLINEDQFNLIGD